MLRREYIVHGAPSESRALSARASALDSRARALVLARDTEEAARGSLLGAIGVRAGSPAAGARRLATALELADNDEFVRTVAQRVLRKVRARARGGAGGSGLWHRSPPAHLRACRCVLR